MVNELFVKEKEESLLTAPVTLGGKEREASCHVRISMPYLCFEPA
jgi:hypothetical protein